MHLHDRAAGSGWLSAEGEPVISVLITAYNRERYLAEAITSVLRSSIDDFEVIVVDDASTDRTAEIAAGFSASDSRVRVFVNDHNLGDYQNRNRAASFARGRYIKYLDSDDVIYRHGLEMMIHCMESFPEAALGLSAHPRPDCPYPQLLSPRDAYMEHFFRYDLLSRPPGWAILRRSAFEAVGGFSGQRYIGDIELWLLMARRYPVVAMPAGLVWDRQHPEQEKNLVAVEQSALQAEVQRTALSRDDCPLTPDECRRAMAVLDRRMGRHFWRLLRAESGLRNARTFRRGAAVPSNAIGQAALDLLRDAFPIGLRRRREA